MTPRITTLARLDVALQHRNGIYYAYAFVVAFYAAIIHFAGPALPAAAVGFIIWSDPAVLGFFFLGALMMLEKAEGARAALGVSPASPLDYILAKTVTLTALAVVAVAITGAVSPRQVDWPVLIASTVLVSVQFIWLGIPVALLFRTVSEYLIGAAGLLTPVILPGLLAFYDPMPWWAVPIPAASQLKLILMGVGAGTAGGAQLAAMFLVASAAAAGCLWFALRTLSKELGAQ
jgi:fluoroquinolone transport system permease protein